MPQAASLTSYYFGGVYETRSDGTTLKYYSFAGQMIAMRDGTGLKYLLTDHLGSIVAVTAANGTLITQQRYLPFGGERTDVPSPQSAGTDYGYTGQRDLGDELGLMDYRARFFSPTLGRFIQPDSMIPNPVNPQSWNRYSYVMNRPVNFNDPSGHCPEEMPECRKILYDLLPKPKPSGGGGNPGGNGGLDPEEYTYHLHSDTNLYELGWQNFGQAWSIGTNPNASIGQKLFAAEYMGVWGGAHAAFVFGAAVLLWNAVVTGGTACASIPDKCKTIPDNAFVRFDPTWADKSINKNGLLTSYSGGRIWLTQYQYVKNISNPKAVETIIYSQKLWSTMAGKFDAGATLRFVNIGSATPAGVSNMVNGIPQWFITNNVPPELLEIIKVLTP